MSDVKSLSQLMEEFDPQGEKVEKEAYLGHQLTIQKIKPWKGDGGKMCVRVIAVDESTGELIHFNGGEPMYNGVKDYVDKVPFTCQLAQYPAKNGKDFWVLE